MTGDGENTRKCMRYNLQHYYIRYTAVPRKPPGLYTYRYIILNYIIQKRFWKLFIF